MKRSSLLLLVLLLLFSAHSLRSQSIDVVWDLYGKKEYQKVIELGKEALKEHPENALLKLAIGRALADSKKYKEAIPYLEKGKQNNDNPAWVRSWSCGYLGLCYYKIDDFHHSKENLVQSISLNATKNATEFAQKKLRRFQMEDFFDSWEIIETEHFRFHVQKGNDIADLDQYVSERESAYNQINNFFEANPYKKIDFFVWNNNEDAQKVLGRELGFANSYLCIINVLPNQTRGHEITHILLDFGIQPVPDKKRKLINEGIAVYFDQTNRNRLAVAKETLKGKEVNVKDLWNSKMEYPETYYYSIGGALIEFLREKGNEAQLKKMLAHQTPEAAIEIYRNFDQLIIEFENDLTH